MAGCQDGRDQGDTSHSQRIFGTGDRGDFADREYTEGKLKSHRGGDGLQTATGRISVKAGWGGGEGVEEPDSGDEFSAPPKTGAKSPGDACGGNDHNRTCPGTVGDHRSEGTGRAGNADLRWKTERAGDGETHQKYIESCKERGETGGSGTGCDLWTAGRKDEGYRGYKGDHK